MYVTHDWHLRSACMLRTHVTERFSKWHGKDVGHVGILSDSCLVIHAGGFAGFIWAFMLGDCKR